MGETSLQSAPPLPNVGMRSEARRIPSARVPHFLATLWSLSAHRCVERNRGERIDDGRGGGIERLAQFLNQSPPHYSCEMLSEGAARAVTTSSKQRANPAHVARGNVSRMAGRRGTCEVARGACVEVRHLACRVSCVKPSVPSEIAGHNHLNAKSQHLKVNTVLSCQILRAGADRARMRFGGGTRWAAALTVVCLARLAEGDESNQRYVEGDEVRPNAALSCFRYNLARSQPSRLHRSL